MLDLRAGSGVTLTKDPASGTLKIDVGVSANDLFIDPRKGPYNAAGNGTTDDAAALQSALNTGKLVYLDPSLTFAFGTRLLPPSGGGFIGGGTLLMLTGTGKFDASDYVSSSYDRTIGIYAEGLSNITINAKIQMQANAAIRTCNAIWRFLASRKCASGRSSGIAIKVATSELTSTTLRRTATRSPQCN
jgi:hypothetical protein